MPSAPRLSRAAIRLTIVLALLATLAGCGSGLSSDSDARAESRHAPSLGCPQTVLATLAGILQRVYDEGVHSERTASAKHMIEHSVALRRAIEAGDQSAALAAAAKLLGTGHMTNLDVRAAGRTLVSVGGAALTPLHGTILGASGKPIATYMTSVWADSGFSAEGSGVAEGLVALRAGGRSIGGTIELPEGPLPARGSLSTGGVAYQYTSFTGRDYPSGRAVQIYLLKPLTAVQELCGASDTDTQLATLKRVGQLIYDGEKGARTLVQVRRVQGYGPLLAAVARRDAVATRKAVAALLHQHIVRLRVSAGGRLLADDGGPFVLAPVHAELSLHGRTIGSLVLSIQDDEGYLRLARRLAGLRVLMFMEGPGGKPRLVKNSLGPKPGRVPANGAYIYRGHSFLVFTVHGEAFPSGPLTIRVLVPQPYR
ncbi:MAG: hypothetical protein JWM60_1750 [Solirubrobacterales bacterium]|nr:hypothetical protein [Solirubrobacterales bacterium]